jgi:hypothetical protein
MADLKKQALLAWDQFLDKDPETAVPEIYAHASAFSLKAREWYWTKIPSRRRWATFTRVWSYALGGLGVLTPILAAIFAEERTRLTCTQIGVAAAAVAGLAQMADRAFGWSTGWLRYVSAVTDMEKHTLKFELEWGAYCIGKRGKLGPDDLKPLFEIAVQLEMAIQSRRDEETASWATEFTSGTAALNEMINAQKQALAQSASAQVDALKLGAVEVTILQTTPPKPVTLTLDGEHQETFTGTSWAAPALPPRSYTVGVAVDSQRPDIKVAVVKAGCVTHVEFKL